MDNASNIYHDLYAIDPSILDEFTEDELQYQDTEDQESLDQCVQSLGQNLFFHDWDHEITSEDALKEQYKRQLQKLHKNWRHILNEIVRCESNLVKDYNGKVCLIVGEEKWRSREFKWGDRVSRFGSIVDVEEVWMKIVEYLDMETILSLRLTCGLWCHRVRKFGVGSFVLSSKTSRVFKYFNRIRLTIVNHTLRTTMDQISKSSHPEVESLSLHYPYRFNSWSDQPGLLKKLVLACPNIRHLKIKNLHFPLDEFPCNLNTLKISSTFEFNNENWRIWNNYLWKVVNGKQLRILYLHNLKSLNIVHIKQLIPILLKLKNIKEIGFPSQVLSENDVQHIITRNSSLKKIVALDGNTINVVLDNLENLTQLIKVTIPISCGKSHISRFLSSVPHVSIVISNCGNWDNIANNGIENIKTRILTLSDTKEKLKHVKKSISSFSDLFSISSSIQTLKLKGSTVEYITHILKLLPKKSSLKEVMIKITSQNALEFQYKRPEYFLAIVWELVHILPRTVQHFHVKFEVRVLAKLIIYDSYSENDFQNFFLPRLKDCPHIKSIHMEAKEESPRILPKLNRMFRNLLSKLSREKNGLSKISQGESRKRKSEEDTYIRPNKRDRLDSPQ